MLWAQDHPSILRFIYLYRGVSLGTSRVLPNRQLKLEILGFNNSKAGDFIVPKLPLAPSERKMPAPLTLKYLLGKSVSLQKIEPEEWPNWSHIVDFLPLKSNSDAFLRQQTEAYLAHDYEYLYLGAFAEENIRNPIFKSEDVARNERIEFMIVRPDGKGHYATYINGMPSESDDIVCRSEIVPGSGYRVFIEIPIERLKFDMQRTPVKIKANLFRVRQGVNLENSSWAPMRQAFNETHLYGTLIMHFEKDPVKKNGNL